MERNVWFIPGRSQNLNYNTCVTTVQVGLWLVRLQFHCSVTVSSPGQWGRTLTWPRSFPCGISSPPRTSAPLVDVTGRRRGDKNRSVPTLWEVGRLSQLRTNLTYHHFSPGPAGCNVCTWKSCKLLWSKRVEKNTSVTWSKYKYRVYIYVRGFFSLNVREKR